MLKTTSKSLFDLNPTIFELKKHSALAQMNNVTTLMQRKAINAFLSIAKDQRKRNPEATMFEVDLWVLKELAGIHVSNNTKLKHSLKALVSLVIEYNILHKDQYEWGAFAFLSFIKIKGERGKSAKVSFSLPQPILESLDQPKMYLKLNLLLQRGIDSKSGLALYELLLDYVGIKKISISMKDFRNLMGVKPNQYTNTAMLIKKVVEVWISEVMKHTSLKVDYSLERQGRKITKINFFMERNEKERTKQGDNKLIKDRLKYFWFKDQQIKNLLQNHDTDYLLTNIAVIEEQINKGKKIKNITAYLAKAFVVDFRKTETGYVRKQKKKQEEKKEIALQKEQEAEALEQLKKTYQQERREKINTILEELSTNEKDTLKSEFTEWMLASDTMKHLYNTKGFENVIIQGRWRDFIGSRFLASEYVSFENYERLKSEPPNSTAW